MNTPEVSPVVCPHYAECRAASNLFALGEMVARDQMYIADMLVGINDAEERQVKREETRASLELEMAQELFESAAEGEITHAEAEDALTQKDEALEELDTELGGMVKDSNKRILGILADSGLFSKEKLEELADTDLPAEQRRARQIENLDKATEFKEHLAEIADNLVDNCPEEISGFQYLLHTLREAVPFTGTNSIHFLRPCPNRELIRAMKALRKEPWYKDNSERANYWLPNRFD